MLPARAAQLERLLGVVAALTAAVTALVYAGGAAALLAYPYEWDPSEGGALEGAYRLVHHPAALYPAQSVVPHPFPLPPLQALVQVPFVLATGGDLRGPRALSALILVAILAAMFGLARRAGASRLVSLVAATTLLAPLNDSFWLMLVRVDGLMIALLVWAALVSLPPALARGAAVLSTGRALGSALLLVLACLAKPSAVAHGAPLVLVWLLVDGRSFVKLAAATTLLGLAVTLALNLATHGGFVAANRLWLLHSQSTAQLGQLAGLFVTTHAPLMLALAVVALVAWRRGDRPVRDAGWALYLAGAVGVSMLGKFGAWTSYLLLWVAAHGVLLARLGRRDPEARSLTLGLMTLVMLSALARSSFPTPTAQDRASAAYLHDWVRARGGPLLATKLESLYVAVGQDEEVESDGLSALVHAHAPGIELLFERLANRGYHTVATHAHGLPLPARQLLTSRYQLVGSCEIGFWHTHYRYSLWVPPAEAATVDFTPPAGSACLRIR